MPSGSPEPRLPPQTLMPDADDDLRVLFHRLNNALGVILAHAELLHTKAPDDQNRARAAHVVESAIDAMTTVREIRQRVPETSEPALVSDAATAPQAR
jgi:hypothetical protein